MIICKEILFQYFETNPNKGEFILEFKFSTNIKAYDILMKLLFGFKDVHILNDEYIQIFAFIKELSKTFNSLYNVLF